MNDTDTTSTDTTTDGTATTMAPERRDLLDALGVHRELLRQTTAGLTDEQARERSTVSDLSVGGIIKHVAHTEADWADFMVNGAPADDIDWSNPDEATLAAYHAGFRLSDDETLTEVLAEYERIAAATDLLVAQIDLDQSFPLPSAPWFPPGAERSARRTIAHIIAETAQHAGHADIIRESIDGAKSMG
ncbi:MAG: DinB family protein [Ilumatobacter sp.]|uniref:DinB family protein n=1 Tax=Ilumatobacter sp. TaxID=1967498 RepID=UPI0032989AA9